MATRPEELGNAYDEVPYRSYPFPQTHPSRFATIATFLGMRPAPVGNCRVLELACSAGGNIIPMASQLPESRFVGVDASRVAITEANKTVDALGLRNIQFHHQNILDVGPAFGQFDYIIAHGVFSWVSNKVQDKIVELCAENLSPQGIAYVSYNTYPGWHMRGMMRDVMFYRARFFDRPGDRLREARALVDFLAKSTPTEGNPYGMMLNGELRLLQGKEDYYLIHEFLEENNVPLYFYQFMERAQEKGLQYLGEAEYSMMSVNNFPPEIATMLQRISSDTVEMEQYMDFVRNRMFRQTLLCHRDVPLDRNPVPERVFAMYAASNAEPEVSINDLRSRERIIFRRPGSTLTTQEPLVKAAIVHLRAVWPQWVPFQDLLASARSKLNSGPQIIHAERDCAEARILADALLRGYATTHIDLSLFPSLPSLEPANQPTISPLARLQSQTSHTVTNLWHESVRLTDMQRFLAQRLDGEHDRASLTDMLLGEIHAGRLVVHDNGKPVMDDGHRNRVVARIIEENLNELARRGLLTGTHS